MNVHPLQSSALTATQSSAFAAYAGGSVAHASALAGRHHGDQQGIIIVGGRGGAGAAKAMEPEEDPMGPPRAFSEASDLGWDVFQVFKANPAADRGIIIVGGFGGEGAAKVMEPEEDPMGPPRAFAEASEVGAAKVMEPEEDPMGPPRAYSEVSELSGDAFQVLKADPGADQGIIIVGGRDAAPANAMNSIAERGIIIVGGSPQTAAMLPAFNVNSIANRALLGLG